MNAKSRDGGIQLGLIVTPLLDVSFQLLAFFIMAYAPNADERWIDAASGRAEIGKPAAPGSGLPPKDVAAPEDQINVLLTPDKTTGAPAAIHVRKSSDLADAKTSIDMGRGELAALVELERRLTALAKESTELGTRMSVRIEADNAMRFDYVMRVYALCRKIGLENVRFAAVD
ncbi:MAG: biopolymer transporter ExbD [Gemmataceae bacterium]